MRRLTFCCILQTNAADLMDRVLYLPVHKRVPFHALLRQALVMHRVIERIEKKNGVAAPSPEAPLTSKL